MLAVYKVRTNCKYENKKKYVAGIQQIAYVKKKVLKIRQLLLSFVRSTKLALLNLKNEFVALIACGSIVNNSLTSPGYPGNYPSNMDCNYSLPIPEGTHMKISFHVFELEADSYRCR